MKTLITTSLSLFIFLANAVRADAVNINRLEVRFTRLAEDCQIRVLVQSPPVSVPVRADVLFLIGFADRADNHGPLFESMANAGYRVISFDYPSHGESNCGGLDSQDFASLSKMAEEIIAPLTEDSFRPLYLTGWSTGGLLAMRIAQLNYFSNRTIAGLLLLAPGLATYMAPGDWGTVTLDTLLSNPNPPHRGPIKPTSPFSFIKFGLILIGNGIAARNERLPKVPILIFLGGSKSDVYADTSTIRRWIWFEQRFHSNLFAIQCDHAKHELDNETEPIGGEVRSNFLNFLLSPNEKSLKTGSSCRVLH
jgi:alpha-beta hydrolase superfamily lysophospholipase